MLELLRKHSNRPNTQNSGPTLRQIKPATGEVAERFQMQKSYDLVREKIELIDVVELTLPEEVGTGGRPRLNPPSNGKFDYLAEDLFSEQALSEEILF